MERLGARDLPTTMFLLRRLIWMTLVSAMVCLFVEVERVASHEYAPGHFIFPIYLSACINMLGI